MYATAVLAVAVYLIDLAGQDSPASVVMQVLAKLIRLAKPLELVFSVLSMRCDNPASEQRRHL